MICEKCNKDKKKHVRTKLPFEMGDDWVLCCPGQDDDSYETYKAKYPRVKFKVVIEVIEREEGKYSGSSTVEDIDSKMKEVAIGLYELKMVEQSLIDRKWAGVEGYEVSKDECNN